ncbi:calpain-10 [Protopterus annectens]|uniref:calpain-10 n=1 Tax=Protopterus annectens TaxID=7888 RepID=UPI001CFBBC6B|nr:calpain-10 [Protopterus annectens]
MESCKRDLRWWLNSQDLTMGRPFVLPSPTATNLALQGQIVQYRIWDHSPRLFVFEKAQFFSLEAWGEGATDKYKEISASPRLFTDDHHEGQVKQGILGDCWFLCACAALQENQQLLTKVLPLDQPVWTSCSYTGQFICRFWQFGMWVEVIIDDRLPCVGGKLCFSHCQSEEVFWLPLLEKAYAKLHGCYEDLWAGKVADALLDITGGIVERWTLGSTGSKAMVHEAGGVIMNVALTNLLEQKNKYFVCSVYRPYEGSSNLAEYHAFNVTEVKDVPGLNGVTVRLIRIWNPWGRPCWNGRWTEGPRLTQH